MLIERVFTAVIGRYRFEYFKSPTVRETLAEAALMCSFHLRLKDLICYMEALHSVSAQASNSSSSLVFRFIKMALFENVVDGSSKNWFTLTEKNFKYPYKQWGRHISYTTQRWFCWRQTMAGFPPDAAKEQPSVKLLRQNIARRGRNRGERIPSPQKIPPAAVVTRHLMRRMIHAKWPNQMIETPGSCQGNWRSLFP